MPSWANNPDYTLHATTTKSDDAKHKAVFEIFDGDKKQQPLIEQPEEKAEEDGKESESELKKRSSTTRF
jgi:hypothetical protein